MATKFPTLVKEEDFQKSKLQRGVAALDEFQKKETQEAMQRSLQKIEEHINDPVDFDDGSFRWHPTTGDVVITANNNPIGKTLDPDSVETIINRWYGGEYEPTMRSNHERNADISPPVSMDEPAPSGGGGNLSDPGELGFEGLDIGSENEDSGIQNAMSLDEASIIQQEWEDAGFFGLAPGIKRLQGVPMPDLGSDPSGLQGVPMPDLGSDKKNNKLTLAKNTYLKKLPPDEQEWEDVDDNIKQAFISVWGERYKGQTNLTAEEIAKKRWEWENERNLLGTEQAKDDEKWNKEIKKFFTESPPPAPPSTAKPAPEGSIQRVPLRPEEQKEEATIQQPGQGETVVYPIVGRNFGPEQVINPFGGQQVRSSGFGGNLPKSNVGVDLQANLGDPIAAPRSGVIFILGRGMKGWEESGQYIDDNGKVVYPSAIVETDDSGAVLDLDNVHAGYGITIMIVATDGSRHRLSHMSRIPKGLKVGQKVNAGDVIGYVGATGNATGPHLDYEYYIPLEGGGYQLSDAIAQFTGQGGGDPIPPINLPSIPQSAISVVGEQSADIVYPVVGHPLKVNNPFGGEQYKGPTIDPTEKFPTKNSGVDLFAPGGTSIASPRSGTVIQAGGTETTGAHHGYGNTVVIKAEDGTVHRLSHLSNVQVKKGDKLSAGDIIGLSGNTGNTTGPHLDYEFYSPYGQLLDATLQFEQSSQPSTSSSTGGALDMFQTGFQQMGKLWGRFGSLFTDEETQSIQGQGALGEDDFDDPELFEEEPYTPDFAPEIHQPHPEGQKIAAVLEETQRQKRAAANSRINTIFGDRNLNQFLQSYRTDGVRLEQDPSEPFSEDFTGSLAMLLANQDGLSTESVKNALTEEPSVETVVANTREYIESWPWLLRGFGPEGLLTKGSQQAVELIRNPKQAYADILGRPLTPKENQFFNNVWEDLQKDSGWGEAVITQVLSATAERTLLDRKQGEEHLKKGVTAYVNGDEFEAGKQMLGYLFQTHVQPIWDWGEIVLPAGKGTRAFKMASRFPVLGKAVRTADRIFSEPRALLSKAGLSLALDGISVAMEKFGQGDMTGQEMSKHLEEVLPDGPLAFTKLLGLDVILKDETFNDLRDPETKIKVLANYGHWVELSWAGKDLVGGIGKLLQRYGDDSWRGIAPHALKDIRDVPGHIKAAPTTAPVLVARILRNVKHPVRILLNTIASAPTKASGAFKEAKETARDVILDIEAITNPSVRSLTKTAGRVWQQEPGRLPRRLQDEIVIPGEVKPPVEPPSLFIPGRVTTDPEPLYIPGPKSQPIDPVNATEARLRRILSPYWPVGKKAVDQEAELVEQLAPFIKKGPKVDGKIPLDPRAIEKAVQTAFYSAAPIGTLVTGEDQSLQERIMNGGIFAALSFATGKTIAGRNRLEFLKKYYYPEKLKTVPDASTIVNRLQAVSDVAYDPFATASFTKPGGWKAEEIQNVLNMRDPLNPLGAHSKGQVATIGQIAEKFNTTDVDVHNVLAAHFGYDPGIQEYLQVIADQGYRKQRLFPHEIRMVPYAYNQGFNQKQIAEIFVHIRENLGLDNQSVSDLTTSISGLVSKWGIGRSASQSSSLTEIRRSIDKTQVELKGGPTLGLRIPYGEQSLGINTWEDFLNTARDYRNEKVITSKEYDNIINGIKDGTIVDIVDRPSKRHVAVRLLGSGGEHYEIAGSSLEAVRMFQLDNMRHTNGKHRFNVTKYTGLIPFEAELPVYTRKPAVAIKARGRVDSLPQVMGEAKHRTYVPDLFIEELDEQGTTIKIIIEEIKPATYVTGIRSYSKKAEYIEGGKKKIGYILDQDLILAKAKAAKDYFQQIELQMPKTEIEFKIVTEKTILMDAGKGLEDDITDLINLEKIPSFSDYYKKINKLETVQTSITKEFAQYKNDLRQIEAIRKKAKPTFYDNLLKDRYEKFEQFQTEKTPPSGINAASTALGFFVLPQGEPGEEDAPLHERMATAVLGGALMTASLKRFRRTVNLSEDLLPLGVQKDIGAVTKAVGRRAPQPIEVGSNVTDVSRKKRRTGVIVEESNDIYTVQLDPKPGFRLGEKVERTSEQLISHGNTKAGAAIDAYTQSFDYGSPESLRAGNDLQEAVLSKGVQWFRKIFIDKTAPTEAFEEALAKILERPISTEESAYVLQRFLPAVASAEGVRIKRILEPLEELSGEEEKLLNVYLGMQRNNDIANYMAKYHNKPLKRASNGTVQLMLDKYQLVPGGGVVAQTRIRAEFVQRLGKDGKDGEDRADKIIELAENIKSSWRDLQNELVAEGLLSRTKVNKFQEDFPNFIQTNVSIDNASIDAIDDIVSEGKLFNFTAESLENITSNITQELPVNTYMRTRMALAHTVLRNKIKRKLYELHLMAREHGVDTGIRAYRKIPKVEAKPAHFAFPKKLVPKTKARSAYFVSADISGLGDMGQKHKSVTAGAGHKMQTLHQTKGGKQEQITLVIPNQLQSVFELLETHSKGDQVLRVLGMLLQVPLFRWGTTIASTSFIPTNMIIDAITFLQRSGTWLEKNPRVAGGELATAYRDLVLGNQAAIAGGSIIFGGGIGSMTGDTLSDKARNAAIAAGTLGVLGLTAGRISGLPKIPKDFDDLVEVGGGQTNLFIGPRTVDDVRKEMTKNTFGTNSDEIWQNLKNLNLIDGVLRPVRDSNTLIRYVTDALSLRPVTAFGEAVESAPRLAAWRLAKKASKSDLEAALMARDITLDFQRSGTFIKGLNHLIPYLNASIQGIERMFTKDFSLLFKKDPKTGKWLKGAATRAFAYSILPVIYTTVGSELLGRSYDLPGWLNIPDYLKDRGWTTLLPVDTGRYPNGDKKPPLVVWIPSDRREHMFIKRTIISAMEAALGDDPLAWDDARKIFFAALVPVEDVSSFMPPAMQQFAEWVANYDYFRGRPIVPSNVAYIYPPKEQTGRYTSETAKTLGETLGVSPLKIDHLIRGLAGTVGKQVTDTIDYALLGKEEKEKALSFGEKVRDVPFLGTAPGRFIRPAGRSQKEINEQNRVDKIINTRQEKALEWMRGTAEYQNAIKNKRDSMERSLLGRIKQTDAIEKRLGIIVGEKVKKIIINILDHNISVSLPIDPQFRIEGEDIPLNKEQEQVYYDILENDLYNSIDATNLQEYLETVVLPKIKGQSLERQAAMFTGVFKILRNSTKARMQNTPGFKEDLLGISSSLDIQPTPTRKLTQEEAIARFRRYFSEK